MTSWLRKKTRQHYNVLQVDEVKESVDVAHGRADVLELKSFKLDATCKEAKDALEKKILYLEAYSRRENLKFAGNPGA